MSGPSGRGGRTALLLWLLPALIVMVGAGCKQESAATGEAETVAGAATVIDPVGRYDLETVDGKPVPCTVRHEGHTIAIDSGSFMSNADGTCSSQMTLAGRAAAIEVKASCTRLGPKLSMQWQGAGRTSGIVESNTFTMTNEGMVFVYRKQVGDQAQA